MNILKNKIPFQPIAFKRFPKSNLFLFFLLFLSLIFGCKKENAFVKETVVDNYIYEINPIVVYQSNVEKTRQKSAELYISGLHANLFQTPIASSDLADLSEFQQASGDKQLADELVLNNYINSGGAIIPSNLEMRSDIESFIRDIYLRFFLREPSPYEILELEREIESDAGLTPALLYQAFALSNEYKFY